MLPTLTKYFFDYWSLFELKAIPYGYMRTIYFCRRNDNGDMSSSAYADLQKIVENLEWRVGTRRTTYKNALEKWTMHTYVDGEVC